MTKQLAACHQAEAEGTDAQSEPVASAGSPRGQTKQLDRVPISFRSLPGWDDDDHAAAFRALVKSAAVLVSDAPGNAPGDDTSGVSLSPALRRILQRALQHAGRGLAGLDARSFFEHFFLPHRAVRHDIEGLVTGYYEPILAGSRVATEEFPIPLYRRPADLVSVVDDTLRGAAGLQLTHMRRTVGDTLEAYATRSEIEGGALADQGLELVWLADPVEAFFVHVQGSAVIRFQDGSSSRIAYDGKNGHPYSSIGRYLIEMGEIAAEAMSLHRLGAYLRADAVRGREVMHKNLSFVFFRELQSEGGAKPATAALGARSIPLTPGRSLAIDASFHELGTPIFVCAPALTHAAGGRAFRRLMVAQDVGSAIRGPERGDIFFGSGARAGTLAGQTKHACTFHVLLPRASAGRVGGGEAG